MTFAKLSAAAIALVIAAGSAQAFTYDNRTNQNPDGSARFADSDGLPAKHGDDDGKSGLSLKFSGSGMNQAPAGVDSRFMPSANPVFSPPGTQPNNFDMALGNRHW